MTNLWTSTACYSDSLSFLHLRFFHGSSSCNSSYISAAAILIYSYPFMVQFSIPYKHVFKARIREVLILMYFWIIEGLKFVVMRPNEVENIHEFLFRIKYF
jgi:hypothetical protein